MNKPMIELADLLSIQHDNLPREVLAERVSEKAIGEIRRLREELTLSTDQNDMVLDEFIRVKLLTNNTEIHQLCERAHLRMRQRVSVIERNHRQQKEISELRKRIAELENSITQHTRGTADDNHA